MGMITVRSHVGGFGRNNTLILVKHLERFPAREWSVRICFYSLSWTVSLCAYPRAFLWTCWLWEVVTERRKIRTRIRTHTRGHKTCFSKGHIVNIWRPQGPWQWLDTAVVVWTHLLTILTWMDMPWAIKHFLLTLEFEHHIIFTSQNIIFSLFSIIQKVKKKEIKEMGLRKIGGRLPFNLLALVHQLPTHS